MYIYIYACLFKPFSKKTLFLGAPLNFQILPSILVYANGSKFLYFQMHLTYTYIIYILIYSIFQAVPQNYNGIQPLIGFHVNKHRWQTSTFMWQTMANPRINLSFGDALYSDMYHPFMMILGRIFRSIQTTHHITQLVLRVLVG